MSLINSLAKTPVPSAIGVGVVTAGVLAVFMGLGASGYGKPNPHPLTGLPHLLMTTIIPIVCGVLNATAFYIVFSGIKRRGGG